jgi:hypothetical protein
MRSSGWVHVFFAPLLACGGGGSAVDAGADPDTGFVSTCPVPEGRSFIASRMELLPTGGGFDLTGDGEINNEMGKMPEAARAEISEGLNLSITVGEMILLAHITGWDPPTPDATDVGFYLFIGSDADSPPDPSNNHGGEGEFRVSLGQFDLECNPRTEADEVEIAGRVLTARRRTWDFPLTTGTGSVVLVNPVLELAFDESHTSATGRVGMVMTLCSLSAIPFPGLQTGTTLDVIVNEPSLQELSVDIDLDDDGLEEVRGDGVTIRDCVDGDGVTVIEGRTCPCHPAIADGYSFAITLEAVPARILGTEE